MPTADDVIATGQTVVKAGQTAKDVLGTVESVTKTIGNWFRGSSGVDWEKANSIAMPVATKVTTQLVSQLGPDKIQGVFSSYAAKLKEYIRGSPHNPTETLNFINAIDREAIAMQPGFRLHAFPFDVTAQSQLAWTLWLHSHWLFEGTSQDEVANGGAYKKFEASLVPTLVTAIQETTGQTVVVTETSNPVITTTTTSVKASIFSNPLVMLAVAGGLVFALVRYGKGK